MRFPWIPPLACCENCPWTRALTVLAPTLPALAVHGLRLKAARIFKTCRNSVPFIILNARMKHIPEQQREGYRRIRLILAPRFAAIVWKTALWSLWMKNIKKKKRSIAWLTGKNRLMNQKTIVTKLTATLLRRLVWSLLIAGVYTLHPSRLPSITPHLRSTLTKPPLRTGQPRS